MRLAIQLHLDKKLRIKKKPGLQSAHNRPFIKILSTHSTPTLCTGHKKKCIL